MQWQRGYQQPLEAALGGTGRCVVCGCMKLSTKVAVRKSMHYSGSAKSNAACPQCRYQQPLEAILGGTGGDVCGVWMYETEHTKAAVNGKHVLHLTHPWQRMWRHQQPLAVAPGNEGLRWCVDVMREWKREGFKGDGVLGERATLS